MCTQRPCRCSCDLVHVGDNIDAVWDGPIGGFGYRQCSNDSGARWLEFMVKLPCEGGDYHQLPIHQKGEPRPPGARPAWTWDGDRERPTLTPSILTRKGKPGGDRGTLEETWHGYITAGRAASC